MSQIIRETIMPPYNDSAFAAVSHFLERGGTVVEMTPTEILEVYFSYGLEQDVKVSQNILDMIKVTN